MNIKDLKSIVTSLGNYIWVTLLATDNFVQGVLNLNNSLKNVQSKYNLIVIATNNLSEDTFNILKQEQIQYRVFPYVSFFCNEGRNRKYWTNPEDGNRNTWWDCTLAKNYMFLFTEYDKVCYLDADLEFLENCDEYFDFPTPSAFAAPHSEGMNGGVILIRPNIDHYFQCMNIAMQFGIINDEMVWWKWKPKFKTEMLNHHFPICDMYVASSGEDKRKILHHDGFDKPWLKTEN